MSNNYLLHFCTKTVFVSVWTNGRFLSDKDTQKGWIEFLAARESFRCVFEKPILFFNVSFSQKNLSVVHSAISVRSVRYLLKSGGWGCASSTGLLRLCAPRWCQPGLLHDAGPHIPHELVVDILPRWPVGPHRNCDYDPMTMKTKNLSWSIVLRSGYINK